jgi:hypothetical protein
MCTAGAYLGTWSPRHICSKVQEPRKVMTWSLFQKTLGILVCLTMGFMVILFHKITFLSRNSYDYDKWKLYVCIMTHEFWVIHILKSLSETYLCYLSKWKWNSHVRFTFSVDHGGVLWNVDMNRKYEVKWDMSQNTQVVWEKYDKIWRFIKFTVKIRN